MPLFTDCPTCGKPGYFGDIPVEPAPDTWVKDRFGATHHRAPDGRGWGTPGFYYFGRWDAMWKSRGPLVACAPYGREEPEEPIVVTPVRVR